MTDEEFYDAEIAPALLELGALCKDRGMSFLALVSYGDEGEFGKTLAMGGKTPNVIRYADALDQAAGPRGAVNIDSFMFAVMKEAREIGHGSAILHQLGVPTTPSR